MPDLFDLFKDNESQQHERPSEQVWQKLEKRLDKSRRPKRRAIRFMQLWVVGLIVLLLLFVAAMVWYFSGKNGARGEVVPALHSAIDHAEQEDTPVFKPFNSAEKGPSMQMPNLL